MQIVKEHTKTRTAEFISESQAANILQRNIGTLKNWRYSGRHSDFLPAFKLEGKFFYAAEDVNFFKNIKKSRIVFHVYPRTTVLFTDAPIPKVNPLRELSSAEVAMLFGIPKASLDIWRSKGHFFDILPYERSISRVTYLASDVAAFIMKGREYWQAQSIERNHQYRPRPSS
ncbi:hypothetical protein N5C93_30565 [Pseudomonas nitroreducens]|uniref:hypothetical protein n=1 Tax=Pseudomonas nitroreducens TaxID=46680 RepID=UPI001474DFD4|nr:hypothetical protein [Pseudomonas nitroreducens]MDG9852884.1 hypothetical protein [Pseudomonas nitroreducens]MDH1077183.1 hypothetical protein [Pseudomonas nitroreducens]NMZ76708.1 helix-turn-helix domain-containing protein [Pseudomonas nitroreducens]HCL3146631.1 hypothetical protein [Pseudomonas aeruginosa]